MALSKKLRFEVFKRDGFTCQYCGGHPPDKVLECDHVHPVSKGGKDDINNLVTSCYDCNRGKKHHTLDSVPPTLAENIKMMKEREKQYKEYLKLVRNIEHFIENQVDIVEYIYGKAFDFKWGFSQKFRMSVKKFLNALGLEETKKSMESAIIKCDDPDNALKYFCGVCWGKIRERNG